MTPPSPSSRRQRPAARPTGGARQGTGKRPSLRGRFLTFEGIDGCGKTTQARLLAGRLRAEGLTVCETREPGGTAIGRQLRAVLLNPDSTELRPLPELLLFLADRVQHLEQLVRPALARGEVVLCDRFHDATVAYQGHARGQQPALEALAPFLRSAVLSPPPDLTFWLDLPPSLAAQRMAERAGTASRAPGADESRLDAAGRDFHERVRDGYAAIAAAEPQRVLRVDAEGGPEAVHARIWALLEERYALP